jgi:hypothetical protein
MMRILLAFALMPLASAAFADDPVRDRLAVQGRKALDAEIAAQQFELSREKAKESAVKSARPRTGEKLGFTSQPGQPGQLPKYEFRCGNAREKQEELRNAKERIKAVESRISELKTRDWIVPKLRSNELEVGQVGIITYDGRNPVKAKAVQVIDGNNVIMEWGSTLYWVGMSTAGMVDDKVYVMSPVMHVKGTKSYTTVLGASKTLLEIHATDIEP